MPDLSVQTTIAGALAGVDTSKPLRIAMVCLGRYSGGSPLSLHLARALASKHVVRIVVASEARNLREWLSSGLDVDVHESYGSAGSAVASLIDQHRIRRLARAISAFSPEVVLAPFVHLWVWPLMARVRAPWVYVVHDPKPHPGLAGRIWHMIDRRIARRAGHVIVHSESFIRILNDEFGIDPAGISFVPLGPLTDFLGKDTASVAPRSESSHGPRILFFGRMAQYKGIDVLLEAAPAILSALPNATISLVGSGISRRLAATAASTQGVMLHDRWVDDSEVGTFFRNADVVVLPYTSGTQSAVIPVAATFSLPVIASAVGGLTEQIDHGECGILVPPGDAGALADAVIKLWSDPSRAQALGRSLHEAYLTKRSWSSIGDSVANACQMAIACSTAAIAERAPVG
jgi:glycosyltransferase involved in cell wall biosynthesis